MPKPGDYCFRSLLPHSATRSSEKKKKFIRPFPILSVVTGSSHQHLCQEGRVALLLSLQALLSPLEPTVPFETIDHFTKQSPSCLSLAYTHFLLIAWDKGQAHLQNPSQSPLEPVFQMMGASPVSTKSFSLSGLWCELVPSEGFSFCWSLG